jgi:2'-5' RNA ligase
LPPRIAAQNCRREKLTSFAAFAEFIDKSDHARQAIMKGQLLSDQPAFPGFEAQRSRTDRLLFLTYPDVETAGRIVQRVPDLRTAHGLTGRPIAPDRLHITLNHLGDHAGLPQDMVVLARHAAETLATQPFEVAFDRAVSFEGRPGNRPFVLRGGDGLAALIAFQQTLAQAMIRTGSRIGKWAETNFTPHVTLLYDGRSVAEQAIKPIGWTVSEFALVHSLVGQTRHVVLGRWPLQG